jgi:hypothetical protein
VKPPPIEHVTHKPVPIPLDVVAVMGTLGYFAVRTVRRRRTPRLDA